MIILFDLDGTLIDSTEAILESFHHAFTAGGFPLPEESAITALIGHPLDHMFLMLGVESTAVEHYVQTYKAHYRQISRAKTFLLPGAREAIDTAAQRARLGIVTTKTARYSRELLEHFGVMDRFELLIGREDVTHPKPHPEPIFKALEHFGGGECWLIGDTRLDARAATAAGIGCVGVLSGYDSREALSEETPHVTSDALAAVRYIFSRV